jgi:ABC-type branched-subunit amino acid transport system ATPase component
MSFLRFENVSAGYGPAVVLRNLDLQVDVGEAVAVVGRNGAGKSTLLLSVFGETNVTSGSIVLDGVRIEHQPGYVAAKRGASLSPQGRRILPNLSVRENLLLSRAAGRDGQWNLDSVFALFPILKERARQPGTALSGGQQQMLAIGRALMANPRVLLLDEPSEGLSPVLVDQVVAVLNRIRGTGTGILVVEQHLSLVRRATERFVVLAKGELVGGGPTAAIDSPHFQQLMSL